MAGDRAPKVDIIPWEFRINTFPIVVIPGRTLAKKYNFWEQAEGNEIHIGYHSQKESVVGEKFAVLLPLDGDSNHVVLQIEKGVDERVQKELLPIILQGLKEKGVTVNQVLETKIRSVDTEEMD
ncbi:MAG: hypothetical protein NTU97_01065 [Candidatus Magasanikbacteria bacterium]|nr:hypothetical protein [Candidatus Magasanikbacteria bacterium]